MQPENKFLVSLCCSLLMDLGHNQQQHPTVNSGGVSKVPAAPAFSAAHLPLPFRFLWTMFVNPFCLLFLLIFFGDTFCGHLIWQFFCLLLLPKQKNMLTLRDFFSSIGAFLPFLSVLVSVLQSATVERFSVSRMRNFH